MATHKSTELDVVIIRAQVKISGFTFDAHITPFLLFLLFWTLFSPVSLKSLCWTVCINTPEWHPSSPCAFYTSGLSFPIVFTTNDTPYDTVSYHLQNSFMYISSILSFSGMYFIKLLYSWRNWGLKRLRDYLRGHIYKWQSQKCNLSFKPSILFSTPQKNFQIQWSRLKYPSWMC